MARPLRLELAGGLYHEKLGSGLSLLGSWGQVFHYYILVAVLFGLWEPS